jgi:hypothetical protein
VVFPALGGTKGQRRLQHISEILWDFQIRSMGSLSVLFSLGSAEVRHELLGQAVSSARDRMYHTKKTRERPPSEIHHYRLNGMRS